MSEKTTTPGSLSPYRISIDLTVEVLVCRIRSYRNMVVTVVLYSCSMILLAVVVRTALPLVALSLLFPFCGGYIILDNMNLNEWRSRLLSSWASDNVHLKALGDAIRAMPNLPQTTIETMLRSLPCAGSVRVETGVSSTTRNAIAAAFKAMDGSCLDVIVDRTITYAIVAAAIVAAVALESAYALIVCATIPSLWKIRRASIRRRFGIATRAILDARELSDFDAALCRHILLNRIWEHVPMVEKIRLLSLTC